MRIQAKINGYPGYDSGEAVGRSDSLVRAYVGERLADLQESLGPGNAADALEPLIERAAFANQQDLVRLEMPHEAAERIAAGPVFDADAALLDAADRAPGITSDAVATYVTTLTSLFDARDAALVAAGIALGRG